MNVPISRQRYTVFFEFCFGDKLLELFPQVIVTPLDESHSFPIYEIDLTDEELGGFISQLSHHYDVAVRRRMPEKARKGEISKPESNPLIWLDARGGKFRQR